MKGWIVVSEAGVFLTWVRDVGLNVMFVAVPRFTWTSERDKALRFASRTQAERAAFGAFPGSHSHVERASS